MISKDNFTKVDDGYEIEVEQGKIMVDPSPEGWILTLVNKKGHPIFPTVTTGFVVPGGMTDELREKALEKAVLQANELMERYEQDIQRSEDK